MSIVISPLFTGLCDDAAVFPPGNLALADAVLAHARHASTAYAPIVGAFVLASVDLERLAPLVATAGPGSLRLAVTVPFPHLRATLTQVDRIAAVRLQAVEVSLPVDVAASEVVPTLRHALGDRQTAVFVELPRDGRRQALIHALSGTDVQAKLRTGGVRAELYPDEPELATAVHALTSARVPFKATAGLHHALRNTDPHNGFEQHGFLNLLAATAAALAGADHAEVVAVLAERDGARVASRVRSLAPQVRTAFRSFGTCSITEPVAELAALGLLAPQQTEDAP
jgi:hypothetical protein